MTAPLSVWRVEVLRLTRTRRLLVLACLYLFLGASGPLLARYAQQVFSGLSGSSTVKITFAAPTPADGMLGFYKSASQLGLVACVVVAGLAFCVDARPALSIYYRSRADVAHLLLPRLVATLAATTSAYTLGVAFAWYETTVLIAAPDVAPTLQLWALGLGYTVFAVVVTFAVAGLLRGALAVVGTTIGVLLVLPVAGNAPVVGRWLPSRLATLPADLFHHTGDTSALPALVITALAVVIGVSGGLWRLAARQVAS